MCIMHANHVLVLAGSVRPARRSLAIANWVAGMAGGISGPAFRVVDILDLGLGLGDEPGMAALGGYTRPTTCAWSEMVTAAAGVTIVTPQYNWGYPAPLKNAIDHLYHEWRDKPVLVITYGSRGGDKCAAQLKQVLGGMHVRLCEAMPGLMLARARIEADDGQVEPAIDFAAQAGEVTEALEALVASTSGA
jgi:NAD(P)H-dependent FMN reductase